MNKQIVVRFSELSLKGRNKKDFINLLFFNIKNKLNFLGLKYELLKSYDKFFIIPKDENDQNIDVYLSVLSKISGISWYATMYKVENNKEQIKNTILFVMNKIKDNQTFRVSAKAINKIVFESSEKLTSFVASIILQNSNLKVNLDNYDVEINVHITNNGEVMIYTNKIPGIIGLPAGSNGKGITLLSGGIDSPVAAYKTITRGLNMSFITFLTNVTGSKKVIDKIKSLANEVNKYNGENQHLYLINFTRIQAKIAQLENASYRIILLRRYYFRFCELIADKYGYQLFVTGDSLGQVASQTVDSMTVISEVTNKLIARPLISFSKNEIINQAKKINSFDISNREGEDMCSLFAPNNPVINAKINEVQKLELELEGMDDILNEILENDMKIIKLGK